MLAMTGKVGILPAPPHKARRQPYLGVDYQQLDALCRIYEVHGRNKQPSPAEAHDIFMQLYPKIFLQQKPKLPPIPLLQEKRKESRYALEGKESALESHDISSHLETLQQSMDVVDMDLSRSYKRKINTLSKILKKLPIERSPSEHQTVYKLMKVFPDVTSQLSDRELKELCTFMYIESWEKGSTVFGNQGFHVILKGSAVPQTIPCKKLLGESVVFRSPTPLLDSAPARLEVGSCFGTLERVPDRQINSKILSVVTHDNCEILKISTRDYARIKEQITLHGQAEKQEIIRACSSYKHWPKQSIDKLVALIEWKRFPASYVLVKEGDISPFVGYIKSGHCNILRNLDVLVKLPLRNVVNQVKHVTMGKLSEQESFGEISILLNRPFTCTVVTATEVELGTISPHDLRELDSVTQTLLLQTVEPTFDKLTQEEINSEYVTQEKQKEWQHFKHKVLFETLFYKGIVPGFGKWHHYLPGIQTRNKKSIFQPLSK